MATLHMEVESARSTYSSLTTVQGNLTSELGTLTSSVQGLVGTAWMGNSANEFSSEFEQWRTSMNSLLEHLSTLGQRLNNEISEWENMAANLSGD